jgi:hypothetical protein
MTNMNSITVYIDSDYLALGCDATQDDLDTYAQNLAEHLVTQFPGKTIEVEQKLGGGRTPCPENEEIDEYVRDFQAGDDWTDLLQ